MQSYTLILLEDEIIWEHDILLAFALCPLSEVREVTAEQTVSNGLREQAASFIQSHCLNKTITFLKSRSAVTSARPHPTPRKVWKRTFKNRRWGFLKNIRHLRAVEDDTRHRAVTQWAMYLSGCVRHGQPIPSTKTHSTTVCMSRQSHVTGDGRVPQAGTLITLTDLRCGFTELNPAWNWICWLGSVRITFH